jgi:hypothetical protein
MKMVPRCQSRVASAPTRRQGFARSARRLTPPLTAAAAPAQGAVSSSLTQLLRSSNPTDSVAKFLVDLVMLNQRLSNPSVHAFGATSHPGTDQFSHTAIGKKHPLISSRYLHRAHSGFSNSSLWHAWITRITPEPASRLQLNFNRIVAGIDHFYTVIFAETGEPYNRLRQIPTGFFAAIDRVLAGSGKILPTAPRKSKAYSVFPS